MQKLLLAVVPGVVMVILILTSVACSSSISNSRPSTTTVPPYTSSALATPTATNNGYGSDSSGRYPAPSITVSGAQINYNSSVSSITRMVVRTGNLELVVKSVPDTIAGITKIARDFGGYVVSSQQGKSGERTTGYISIRVLAENYDQTIAALKSLSMDVINETSSSQDVTQEYVDLGSQLKNLQATEAQLLKIMATANKTEDVLSVQSQLTNIEGQIEQTKGRMQYLEQTSATSLISITLDETIIAIKFNADKVLVNAGETIRFTSQTTGGFMPYNYQWDFGDGNTSVEQSPAHAYQKAGEYTVVLKVTDDKGYTNTSARASYINVTGNWNPGNIAGTAIGGLVGFGRVFANILIWLGIFSPIWVAILAILWLTVWRKRRKS